MHVGLRLQGAVVHQRRVGGQVVQRRKVGVRHRELDTRFSFFDVLPAGDVLQHAQLAGFLLVALGQHGVERLAVHFVLGLQLEGTFEGCAGNAIPLELRGCFAIPQMRLGPIGLEVDRHLRVVERQLVLFLRAELAVGGAAVAVERR